MLKYTGLVLVLAIAIASPACDEPLEASRHTTSSSALSYDEPDPGWQNDVSFGLGVRTDETDDATGRSSEPFLVTRATVSVFESHSELKLEEFPFSVSAEDAKRGIFNVVLPRSFDLIDARLEITFVDARGSERRKTVSFPMDRLSTLKRLATPPSVYSEAEIDPLAATNIPQGEAK